MAYQLNILSNDSREDEIFSAVDLVSSYSMHLHWKNLELLFSGNFSSVLHCARQRCFKPAKIATREPNI